MKRKLLPITLGLFLALCVLFPKNMHAQAHKKSKSETVQANDTLQVNKGDVKNRHAMLNASSATQPRQINTGIPPGGTVLILENNVPVIYQFYPQIITSVWKHDATIGRIGLLSLAESALTFGSVGFTVDSYDRFAGRFFRGYFSAYTNSWGSLFYSGDVSGPMGKKGWGYVLGFNETYDRMNGTNREYYPWAGERMGMFKVGISKRFKKGVIRLMYKHAEETLLQANGYQPLIYNGNGSFSQYPGFKLGQDSYTLGSGEIAYADANTGKSIKMNLGDNKYILNTSDAFYLTGEQRFGKGYKLTYSSMFMHSISPFSIQFPLTLGITKADANNQFYLHGTNTAYTKDVQQVVNSLVEPTDILTSLSRAELTRKFGVHRLRLGLTYQFYKTGLQKTDEGMYYQTVTANPKLLDWKMYIPAYNMTVPVTNSDGIVPIPGDESKTDIHKAALYFSDDFSVGRTFNFTIGGRIEKEDDQLVHDQYANSYVENRPLMTVNFKNRWNHAAVGSFIAKVTNDFGFLGGVTYVDYSSNYFDYPQDQKDSLGNPITQKDANGYPIAKTTVAKAHQIKVLFMDAGIYYNHGSLFSLVSKITSSSRNGTVTSMDIYDPANPSSKTHVYPLFYDIQTLGWTTDIVTSPFKNFHFHFLLTIQNPQYKNYKVSGFGHTYVYDNNIIPAMSKVLMEIDPSYNIGDFKLYADLRYYGKQYGNLNNSFYYNPWWENFAGIVYTIGRSCNMKLQVVNFLNQAGISGAMQGADQITKAQESSYIGKPIVASGIRPRTVEFSINFKL